MDDPPPHLPLYLLILLAICACGLVVHFMAESLGSNSNLAVYDLVRHGGHANAHQGCGEDYFIFSLPSRMSAEYVPIPVTLQGTTHPSILPNSPLPPPPNS
jgi:hypothetical protein